MGRTAVAGLLFVGLVTGAVRAAVHDDALRSDAIAVSQQAERWDTLDAPRQAAIGWRSNAATVDWRAVAAGAGAAPTASVRRISHDATTEFDAQHATQVEPASFANGPTIVAAFQNGRFEDGGAAAIGWATSTDAGKHWRTGVLPQSRYSVVSDPVVAYDAVHRTWLISSLGRGGAGVELWVARSRDGVSWGEPVVAAQDRSEEYDKEWVACDNGAHSPYRGRCYMAYVDFEAQQLGVRRSLDGGATWSSAVRVSPSGGPDRPVFTGPFPVVRPDGTLVIPYSVFASTSGEDRIAAVSSRDGGLTFTSPVRVAGVNFVEDADLRAEVMPSVADDSAGRLYGAWSDSSTRDDGVSNDVVFSISADGTAWSQPVRLPLKRNIGGVALSYFLPAIAVAPAGTGAKAQIAVAVYSVRLQNGCATFMPSCKKQVDAWLVRSADGGRKWSAPKLLRTQPMLLDWLATSTRGRMLGDYITVSWSGGKPWAILPLATQSPLGYSQSMFAATAS